MFNLFGLFFTIISLSSLCSCFSFSSDISFVNSSFNIHILYNYSSDLSLSLVNFVDFDLTIFNDYNAKLKYKSNSSLCETIYNVDSFPEYFIKDSDVLINETSINENLTFFSYFRPDLNMTLDFFNDNLSKITFTDGSYYLFNSFNLNPQFNFNTSSCPKPSCSNIVNIIFVLDESGSISEADWIKQIDFCFDIFNKYDIGEQNVKIGIVGFSTFGRIILNLTSSYSLINNTLSSLRYDQVRGGTCTGCGISIAHSMFMNELNGNNSGRNSLNPQNIIILITDGDISQPNYVENCSRNVRSSTPYNYCTGCCKKSFSNTCEGNKMNKCLNVNYDVIIPVSNESCNDYVVFTNYSYNCSNCLCMKSKTSSDFYEVCNECYEYIGDSYPKCYKSKSIYVCSSLYTNEVDIKNYINTNFTNSVINFYNDVNNSLIISVAVGDFDSNFLHKINSTVYSIDNYNSLHNLLNYVVKDVCFYSGLSESCSVECNGICGLFKKCICPTCSSFDDSCLFSSCNVSDDGSESTGCIVHNLTCDAIDRCTDVIRDPEADVCCSYFSNASNCDIYPDNKCIIPNCDPVYGCFYDNVSCDDFNPCTIDTCNPVDGSCSHVPNDIDYNCSKQYYGLIMVSDCSCNGSMCVPAVYREPQCSCSSPCQYPVFDDDEKLCKCFDVDCSSYNTNPCYIYSCVDGSCVQFTNDTKTLECQNLVTEKCKIGFCNPDTGDCDIANSGISENCTPCEVYERDVLNCSSLNNQCYKFVCQEYDNGGIIDRDVHNFIHPVHLSSVIRDSLDDHNISCVLYWEADVNINDKCLNEYCDNDTGIVRDPFPSFIKDCNIYTCHNIVQDGIVVPSYQYESLCPSPNDTYVYNCSIDNQCIPVVNCKPYFFDVVLKSYDKCKVFDTIVDGVCTYKDVDCVYSGSSNCSYSICNPFDGKCNVIHDVNLCDHSVCQNVTCNPVYGCIYSDFVDSLTVVDDVCNYVECIDIDDTCDCYNVSKCQTDKFCKVPSCSINGNCIFDDYNCDDMTPIDECYRFICNEENRSCDQVLKPERFIDYCDVCVKRYGNINNLTNVTCIVDLIHVDKFDNTSLSDSSNTERKKSIWEQWKGWILGGGFSVITAGFAALTALWRTADGKSKIISGVASGASTVGGFFAGIFRKFKKNNETSTTGLFYKESEGYHLESPHELIDF